MEISLIFARMMMFTNQEHAQTMDVQIIPAFQQIQQKSLKLIIVNMDAKAENA